MSGMDLSGLNPEQRRIVTTLDKPLFVEAGAGSGKTFTLTQRIAWALTPGSGADGGPYLDDLSQVLVITFTNAAAREIRERVRSTLRAGGMTEQALQVDSAWISTIHGMCARILRRHALELGIDPAFGIVQGNDAEAFDRQALEEVVGGAYRSAEKGSPLREAFDDYRLGGEGPQGWFGAMGVVQSIREVARSVAGGYDALDFPEAEGVGEAMASLLGEVEALAAQRLTKKATEAVLPILEALRGFGELAPGFRTPEAALETLDGLKLPANAGKAAAEQLRQAKRSLAKARAAALLARSRAWVPDLVGLARRVDARVWELGQAASVLSNDDLIGLALRAVEGNEAVARDYAGRFRLVMVDEFQDTDARQLRLIGILAGEGARHLTTVGDAQQSIYRFRGADVGVFRGRGAALPETGHVRLAVNYRSHPDVLALVDRVCGGEDGVLEGFMHLDANPGRRDTYQARDLPRVSVEVSVGSGSRGKVGAEQAAVAAAAIADRLAEYRDHGEQPGRMALLLGTTTKAGLYIDAIRACGLDCVVTGGSTFTSAPEVTVMAKLLHALANPHDTQSGLFPLLTSEMFELDANDLIQLGTRPQVKLDAPTNRRIDAGIETMEFFHGARPSRRLLLAHDVLERAWDSLGRRPVADVCLQAVRESGWLSRLEAEGPTGLAKEANVLAAVRYIRDLTEGMGLGPARAAEEFDTWLAVSKVPPASLAGGEMQSVRVMTIHASKGLQFPVTAVAECWSARSDTGKLRSMAVGDRRMCVLAPGESPSVPEDEERVGEPSDLVEWYHAIGEENSAADAAERTRLLYVALTRAQEALVVGCNVATSKKGGVAPDLACAFLGALMPAGLPQPGEHRLAYGGSEDGRVRVVSVDRTGDGTVVDAGGALPAVEGVLPEDTRRAATGGTDGGGAGRRPFVMYAPEEDPSVAATRMVPARPGIYSFSSAHAQMEASAGLAPVPDHDGSRPGVGRIPTPAEREAEQEGSPATDDEDRATSFGSAFHELAQCLVEAGRDELPEGRLEATARTWNLSPRNRERLRAALARWGRSDIRREALSHGLVRAEVPFFARAESPYGRYVEGAIDLLCLDQGSEHALLVDYKTGDRGLTAEGIRNRHEMQANFYASVLMGQGMDSVECCFVCVELEDPVRPGEPYVARYEFDRDRPPRIG